MNLILLNDLTLNNGLNGHHQMDVLGKTNNINREDLIKLRKLNYIDKPEEIINKISNLYNEMILLIKKDYINKIPKNIISQLEDNSKNWHIK